MDERRDDTTQPDERDGAPTAPEHTPRNYYYDDGTGYEVYDPAAEDEDEPDGSVDGEAGDDDGMRRG